MPSADVPKRQGEQSDLQSTLSVLAGPSVLDRAVRQSVQHCWITLPAAKRSIAAVAAEMHRLLDRALYDFERDLRGTDAKFE
jgi:hypothetical protein